MNLAYALLLVTLQTATPEVERTAVSSAERGMLPWIERDVWLYSAIGRRMAPERFIALAAAEEARQSWQRAYYFYSRVFEDREGTGVSGAFPQACLGAVRCLVRIGEGRRACRILLDRTGRGGLLHASKPARALLEILLEDAAVREDKRLGRSVRQRLASWPGKEKCAKKTASEEAEAGRRQLAAASVRSPEGVVQKEAGEALETARFYLERNSKAAALVYLRYIVSEHPGTLEARRASFLLKSGDEQPDEGKEAEGAP